MQAVGARPILHSIQLIQLENWSVQTFLESKVQYSNEFELAKIGDFLIKSRNSIDVEDSKTYKRVTVKINNNGVFLRDIEEGINIGTKKQYLVKSGQFIISKIDARNGAFGIIPQELDGAIVTNDFPLFDVNKKRINPYFLLLITTTKEFIKFAQSCSSGTTNRQRMDIDAFLSQKIPLPSIIEQNRIVNNYDKKIRKASELQQTLNALEKSIEKYLVAELGVTNNKVLTKNGLQLVDYENIEKWSLDDIVKKNTITSHSYDLVKLDSLCHSITDGTHQTPTYFKEGVIFLSAKNVTKEVIDWENVKYVSRDAHTEYVKRIKPEIDDILLAKNGTTGVAAIIDSTKEFSFYVSLALLKPIKELVIPRFLLYVINSDIARTQFFSRLIGIGVPNLHLGEIKEVVIPLPPMNKQKFIADKIQKIREEIAAIKGNIQNLKIEANIEFENTIFN